MSNKLISAVVIVVSFVGVFIVFSTVVKAKNLNFFCLKKQDMIITLKDKVDVDICKAKISKVPQVRVIKVQYRDKEWSKMVNKMDLPRMENPFKNEVTVRMSKKANINAIYEQIKGMDFVEKVEYVPDEKSTENKK